MSPITSHAIDHSVASERTPPAHVGAELLGRRLFLLTPAGILLCAAIFVGIMLRFANLGGIPPALNQDEVVNGYDAYSLFLTGRDHHGHPFPFAGLESFGDWASPLLTFLTVPAVGLFGLRPEVVRAVAAAIGVLAIPIVYLLGKELFARRSIGVLAAWFIAVSPWHVHRSRFAIPPAVVPTMVALTIVVLIWTVHRRSARGIVAFAVAAGLTIASYPTMKLYVPLLILAALAIYGKTLIGLKREALCYAVIVFVVIAGPIIYLSLVDPGGRARLDQVSAFNTANVSAGFLAQQYRSYFSPWVFFIAGNGHPGQSPTPPGFGVELRSALPLLLAGFLWLIMAVVRPAQPAQRRAALFLLAALALYPVPGSLTVPTPPLTNPHLSRAIHLIPLVALIAGAGAVALADVARRLLRNAPASVARTLLALAVIAASTLIGLELFTRYADYFNAYPRRENTLEYYQYGLAQALDYAHAHEAQYDEIWIADTNQPYIYVLFYLQWPPSDVHRSLQVRRAPPAFDEVDAIGKYHFGDPPNAEPADLAVLSTVVDPAGTTAYEVRGGETRDRRRILLIRKP